MKKKPVYIAQKINMAFSEGRELWKNVEKIIFTFTSECPKNNLALPPHHIIIRKCNLSMYYKCRGRLLGPELCVIWLLKMPASGWGLLRESSSFAPWFILKMFRDVSGAVPEWPWISEFVRKSSRHANAPSMRFSVLLNSCDNFLVTLPSISSETWLM